MFPRGVSVWLLALGLLGCDRSSATATPDAGVAMLSASLDAGDAAAPHLAATADAGLEDTAMPQSAGEELSARMRHLLEAVSQNNPELAGDVVFPRDAYTAARDAPDPQKAWEKRVNTTFRRSVERMHKRMKGVEHAKFVSFELGRAMVQLTPKRKDFKKPLWRVKHSKLLFTVEGKSRQIDVAEMTAWRGAWYVTRLR